MQRAHPAQVLVPGVIRREIGQEAVARDLPVLRDHVEGAFPVRLAVPDADAVASLAQPGKDERCAFAVYLAGRRSLEPHDLCLAAAQFRRQVYPHVLAAEILRLVERANERVFLHNYPLTEP